LAVNQYNTNIKIDLDKKYQIEKKKTYKPDSVIDGHLSRLTVACELELPTRGQRTGRSVLSAYLALHRMGFAVPFTLP